MPTQTVFFQCSLSSVEGPRSEVTCPIPSIKHHLSNATCEISNFTSQGSLTSSDECAVSMSKVRHSTNVCLYMLKPSQRQATQTRENIPSCVTVHVETPRFLKIIMSRIDVSFRRNTPCSRTMFPQVKSCQAASDEAVVWWVEGSVCLQPLAQKPFNTIATMRTGNSSYDRNTIGPVSTVRQRFLPTVRSMLWPLIQVRQANNLCTWCQHVPIGSGLAL